MPNLASVLKEEIKRLARREVRAEVDSLRKANSQYRRDIAELKRKAVELTRQVDYLERQEKKRTEAGPARPEAEVEGRRFSKRGLKTHRTRLGLSAAEYGRLIGVTAQTVYNWEQGRARPAMPQLAALVELRKLGKREAQRRLDLLEA